MCSSDLKLVNLDEKDLVMAVARVVPEEEGEGDGDEGGEDSGSDTAEE